MRKVLLTVIHYVLFVPIASVVRLFHDPLDRAWDAERASYWIFTGSDMRAAPAEVHVPGIGLGPALPRRAS